MTCSVISCLKILYFLKGNVIIYHQCCTSIMFVPLLRSNALLLTHCIFTSKTGIYTVCVIIICLILYILSLTVDVNNLRIAAKEVNNYIVPCTGEMGHCKILPFPFSTSVSPGVSVILISVHYSALSMTAVYALDIILVPEELTYRNTLMADDDNGNDKDDCADSSDHAGMKKEQGVQEAALHLKYGPRLRFCSSPKLLVN